MKHYCCCCCSVQAEPSWSLSHWPFPTAARDLPASPEHQIFSSFYGEHTLPHSTYSLTEHTLLCTHIVLCTLTYRNSPSSTLFEWSRYLYVLINVVRDVVEGCELCRASVGPGCSHLSLNPLNWRQLCVLGVQRLTLYLLEECDDSQLVLTPL